MRTTILALFFCLSGALFGCGGSGGMQPMQAEEGFIGVWSGTLIINSGTCSDGSMYPASSTPLNWQITAVGSDELLTSISCGDLYLQEQGNVATQTRAITCPPQTTPTGQDTPTIHDTSFVLEGNALQLNMEYDFAFITAGVPGSCKNVTATAVLLKSGGG